LRVERGSIFVEVPSRQLIVWAGFSLENQCPLFHFVL